MIFVAERATEVEFHSCSRACRGHAVCLWQTLLGPTQDRGVSEDAPWIVQLLHVFVMCSGQVAESTGSQSLTRNAIF